MADGNSSFSIKVWDQSDKKLVDQFEKWRIETRLTVIDVLKEEACLTARAAMVFTPPVDGRNGGRGDTKDAERWGKFAIKYDVLQIIGYENKSLAAAAGHNGTSQKFAKWKQGKRPKKEGIIQKIFDDENFGRAYNRAKALFSKNTKITILSTSGQIKKHHDSIRSLYKGRIRRNMGRATKANYVPSLATANLLDNYIEQRQRMVGYLKAGWYDVIKKIGPSKINGMPKNFGVKDLPSFITRHAGKGHGAIREQFVQGTTGGDSYINIVNDLGNIFKIAYENNVVSKVYEVRANKVKRRMAHFQKAINNKFNGIKTIKTPPASTVYNLD